MREITGPLGPAHDRPRPRSRSRRSSRTAGTARSTHGAREVVVHRQLPAAHQRLRVMLRVLAGTRSRPRRVSVSQRSVQLLVARRDPAVELRGRPRAVRKVEVDEHVGDRVRVQAAPGTRAPGPGPERRVAVPADDHQHVVRDTGGDRHRRVLDRGDRRRAAHVHRRRERDGRECRGSPPAPRPSCSPAAASTPSMSATVRPGVRDRLSGDPQHHLDRQRRPRRGRSRSRRRRRSRPCPRSSAHSTDQLELDRVVGRRAAHPPRRRARGGRSPGPIAPSPSPARYARCSRERRDAAVDRGSDVHAVRRTRAARDRRPAGPRPRAPAPRRSAPGRPSGSRRRGPHRGRRSRRHGGRPCSAAPKPQRSA